MTEIQNRDQNPILSLAEVSKQTGYHPDYLGFLCRSGKLKGFRVGRNWMTTQNDLNDFTSNYKNGVKEVTDETGVKIPVHNLTQKEAESEPEVNNVQISPAVVKEEPLNLTVSQLNLLKADIISSLENRVRELAENISKVENTVAKQSEVVNKVESSLIKSTELIANQTAPVNSNNLFSSNFEVSEVSPSLGGEEEVFKPTQVFNKSKLVELYNTFLKPEPRYFPVLVTVFALMLLGTVGTLVLSDANTRSQLSGTPEYTKVVYSPKENSNAQQIVYSTTTLVNINNSTGSNIVNRVLGLTVSEVYSAIDNRLNKYLSEGKFKGEKGEVGAPGVPGVSSSYGGSSSVTYIQPNSTSGFSGGSFTGVTILSADKFTASNAEINTALVVNGSTTFNGGVSFNSSVALATTTISTLSVSGTTTLSNITGLVQCLHVDANGVISGTGVDCGAGGGSGSVSGGTKGYVTTWASSTGLTIGTLIDNGTVAGVNATTSSYTFNIQGTSGVNPFNISSSTGSSIFAVMGNGRVGIGTTTPAQKLHVTGGIRIESSDANNDGRLVITNGSTTMWNLDGNSGDLRIFREDYSATGNGAGGVVRLIVKDGGNVGIGTTNPQAQLSISTTSSSSIILNVSTSTNSNLFNVLASGNVGIGTASPVSKLQVAGVIHADANYSNPTGFSGFIWGLADTANPLISIGWPGSKTSTNYIKSSSGDNLSLEIGAATGGSGILQLMTNDTARIYIAKNGNVGIGTTNPTSVFHIASTSPALTIERTGVTNLSVTNSGSNWTIGSTNGNHISIAPNGTEAMRVINGGNVGIGTSTPTRLLHVSGSSNGTIASLVENLTSNSSSLAAQILKTPDSGAQITLTSGNYTQVPSWADRLLLLSETSSAGINLVARASGGDIRFTTGGDTTERMIITSTGNVGIGTTNPTSTLFIQGTSTNNIFVIASSTGSNFVTVTPSGNVGIGTTTPQASLHVAGNPSTILGIGSGNPGIAFGWADSSQYNRIRSAGVDNSNIIFDLVNPSTHYFAINGDFQALQGVTVGYGAGAVTPPSTGLAVAGNVGIGTTTPQDKLQISAGNIILDNNYFVKGIRTDGVVAAMLGIDTNNFTAIRSSGSALGVKITDTIGTSLLTILNGGNVGIGTSTPGQALVVAGNFYTTGNATTSSLQVTGIPTFNNATTSINGVTYYWPSSLPASNRVLQSDATGNLTWVTDQTGGGGSVSGGAIGFVTTWASSTGLTYGTLRDNGTVAGVNATSSSYTFNIQGTGGVNPFNVASSTGTSLVVVDVNGRVGIGSSSPTDLLTIVGGDISLSRTQYLRFRSETSGGQSAGIGGSTTNDLLFYTNGLGEKMRVTSGGNLGIGTSSPQNTIHVVSADGSLRLDDTNGSANIVMYNNSNTYWQHGASNTTYQLYYNGDTTKSLNITSAGNIGVGTTTPGAKLDIFATDTNSLHVNNNAAVSASSGAGISGFTSAIPTAVDQRLGFYTLGAKDAGNLRNSVAIQGFSSQAWVTGSAAGSYLTFSVTPNNSITRTEAMRIDQAGNVGIGTTTPADKVVVSTATGGVSVYTASGQYGLSIVGGNNSVSESSYISVQGNRAVFGYDGSINSIVVTDIGTGKPIVFRSSSGASLERMRITTTGNVGIGTSTPTALLFVQGTSTLPTTTIFTVASSSGNSLFTVQANGNVGIATSTPAGILDVVGTGYFGTPGVSFGDRLTIWTSGNTSYFGQNANTSRGLAVSVAGGSSVLSGYSGGVTLTDTHTNGFIDLKTNNASRLYINGSGNVGVGTTTPTATLYVQGTSTAGSTNLFTVASSTGTRIMNITARGNVGIGVATPLSKLHVVDGINDSVAWFQNSDAVNGYGVYIQAGGSLTSTRYVLDARNGDGTTVLWAGANGNVGIGTTTPGQKLVVVGDARITGALFDSSNASGTLGMVLQTTGSGTQWVATSSLGIISNGVSGGTNGYVARFTSASALGTGLLLDSGSYAGVNATSSSYTFNIQGSSGVNPLNISSSSGSSLLTINQSGNVGIGTVSPTVGLDVNTTFRAGINTSAGFYVEYPGTNGFGYQTRLTDSGGTNRILFNSYGDSYITNNGQGNLGIGTSTPKTTLSISGTGTVDPFDVSSSSAVSYLHVTQAGNVGIGTTTPDTALHIVQNTTQKGIKVSGGTSGFIHMYVTSAFNYPYIDFGGHDLVFTQGGGERARVSTTGRVSGTYLTAGTTANSGGSTLSVNGNSAIGSTYYTTAAPTDGLIVEGNVGIGTTTPGNLLTVVGSTEITGASGNAFYVDASNRFVGIRTTSPAVPLAVNGSTRINGSLTLSANGLTASNLATINHDNQDLTLSTTGGTGNILFMPLGNVGIGSSTPVQKLVVVGAQSNPTAIFYGGANIDSSTRSGQIVLGDDSTAQGLIGYGYGAGKLYIDNSYNNSAADIIFRSKTSGSAQTNMVITGAGNVGIGTSTPGAVLNIYSATYPAVKFTSLYTPTGGLDIGINGTTPDVYMAQRENADIFFMTAGYERLRIKNSGNVGIGTTSPTGLLHLAGSTNIVANFDSYTSSANGSLISLRKGQGTASVASSTVQGDTLGTIDFEGLTSSGVYSAGAQITSTSSIVQSGTVYSNLVLQTRDTNNGAMTSRMVIDNTGIVNVLGNGQAIPLQVKTTDTTTDFGTSTVAALSVTNLSSTISSYSGIRFNSQNVANAGMLGFVGVQRTSNSNQGGGDLVFGVKASDSSTNVTEYLRLKMGGNVGIGTTTPLGKFHVSAGTAQGIYVDVADSVNSAMKINYTNAANSNAILISQTNSGGNGGVVYSLINVDNRGSNPTFYSSNNSANPFIITSSGNVGIGTSTPQAGLSITTAANNTPALRINHSTNTFADPAVQILQALNVGGAIPTPLGTPSALEVQTNQGTQNSNTNGLYVGVNFALNTSVTSYSKHAGQFVLTDTGTTNPYLTTYYGLKSNVTTSNSSSTAYGLYTSATASGTAYGIYSAAGVNYFNGNVGIGSSTPTQKLVVVGDARITGALFDSNNASGTLGMVLQTTGSGTQWVATSTLGITGGSGVSGGTAGLVARFTSATALSTGLLIDNGSVAGVNATSSSYTFNIQGSSGVNPLNISSSSGTSLLVINQIGNVGIGTSSPSIALGGGLNIVKAGGTDGAALQITANSGQYSRIFMQDYSSGATGGYIGWGNGVNKLFFGKTLTPSASNDLMVLDWSNGGLALGDSTYTGVTAPANGIIVKGNVGIGTTSPLSILHTYSSAGYPTFESSVAGNSVFVTSPNQSAAAFSSEILFTTSPNVRSSATGIARIQAVQTATTSLTGDLAFVTNSGGSFNEAMRIKGSGNVGIGTSSPVRKLTVFNGIYPIPSDLDSNIQAVIGGSSATGLGIMSANNSVSFLHFGDQDAGKRGFIEYWQASDYLALGTAGSEKLRIQSDGNVGIGTTTPIAQLSISTTSSSSIVFNVSTSTNTRIFNVLASGNVGVGLLAPSAYLDVSANSTVGLRVSRDVDVANQYMSFTEGAGGHAITAYGIKDFSIFNNGAYNLIFGTSNSEKMRIDSNGNVGIGTTTPYTPLHLNGIFTLDNWSAAASRMDIRVSGSSKAEIGYGATGVGGTHPTGGYLFSRDGLSFGAYGGATAMFLDVANNGNVGIGTTTPLAKLDLYGNLNVSTGSIPSLFVNTATGNVGIGTTTPLAALQISRNATYNQSSLAGLAVANSSSPGLRLTMGYDSAVDASYLQSVEYGVGSKKLLLNAQGGNVGIGTTSADRALQVEGDIRGNSLYLDQGGSAGTPALRFASGLGIFNSSNNLAFSTGSTERVRITSVGNVGIGTSSPQGQLHLYSGANTALLVDGAGSPYIQINQSNVGKWYTQWNASGAYSETYSLGAHYFTGGNVGIGTSSPTAKLAIQSVANSAETTVLQLQTTGNNTGAGLGISFAFNDEIGMTPNGASISVYKSATSGGKDFIFRNSLGNAAATENMRLDANGNLGIGTSTPVQKLVVAGNARITGALFDSNNASGTLGMILQTTGTTTQWVATSTLGLTGNLSGGTAGLVARWSSASALSTGLLIDNGSVAGVNATSSTVTFNIQGTSGSNNPFVVASSTGTALLTVAPSGAMSLSSGLLHLTNGTSNTINFNTGGVAAPGANSAGAKVILYGTGSNGAMAATDYALGIEGSNIWLNTNGGFKFYTNSSLHTTLSSSLFTTSGAGTFSGGYILLNHGTKNAIGFSNGVGAPTTNSNGLKLNLSTASDNMVPTDQAIGQESGSILWMNAGSGFKLYVSAQPKVAIDANGNFGIGTTSPSATLAVMGTSSLPTANLLTVASSSGAQLFTVTSTGNVGIGTATPAQKLLVVGDARITGALYDSGNASGTLGMVLQTTGTTTQWVATSSLGIIASVSGGTAGMVTRWSTASALSSGLLIDNGTVAGVNATSSATTFNVQGSSGVNPFNISSSTGSSLLSVNTSGTLTLQNHNATMILAHTAIDAGTLAIKFRNHTDDLYKTAIYANSLGAYGRADLIFASNILNDLTSVTTTQARLTISGTNGYVGIGTTTPSDMLTVFGNIMLTGSNSSIYTNASTDLLIKAGTGKKLQLGSNNTDGQMVISSGNVGIGATSPRETLEVRGTTPVLLISTNNDDNGTAWLKFSNHTSASIVGKAGIYTIPDGNGYGRQSMNFALRNTGDFSNVTNSDVLMTLTNTGRLGIGTTSPVATLSVKATSTYSTLPLFTAASSGGTQLFIIDSTGNVGIGTTTPIGKLDIYGNLNVATGSIPTLFVNTATGNIGIGSGSPTATLHVQGRSSAGSTNPFVVSSSTGASLFAVTPSVITSSLSVLLNNDLAYQMKNSVGNTINVVTIDGSSNLYYGGAGVNTINMGSTDARFGLDQNSLYAFVMTSGNERLRVTSVGNVGIGTTTPTQGLHIGSVANGMNVQVAHGWLCVDNNDTCTGANTAGTVYAVGTYTTGADVAENYPTSNYDLEAGDVVSVASSYPVFIDKASSSSAILGVVSTKPGVLLNGYNAEQFENSTTVPVALSGRVPVKVTNENGQIKAGDYLAPSKKFHGYAMRATEEGLVIGRALQDFSSSLPDDSGKVLVFMQVTNFTPKYADLVQFGNIEDQTLIDQLTNLNMTNASVFGNLAVKESLYVGKDLHVAGVIYAATLNVDTVNAKKLCLEDVCVTKDQLKALLDNLNSNNPTPAPVPEPTPEVIPPPTEPVTGEVLGTTTPPTAPEVIPEPPVEEPTVEPVVEPTPEVSIVP